MNFPVDDISRILLLFVLCSVRLAATLAIVPFFSKQFIPGAGRNCVILAMAMPLIPLLIAQLPDYNVNWLTMSGILVKEVTIGGVLGFATGFIFYVSEGVGFVVDVQRGSSMATIFDPMAGSQTSLLGSTLLQIMSAMFFASGGFLFLMSLIYKTYVLWPVFSFSLFPNVTFAQFFLDMFDQIMEVLLCLAAPILIVLFLAEFGLGMVNRFAPQLNVFFLAMPIKSWLSMAFLLMYMNIISGFFKKYFMYDSKILEFLHIFSK
ncbi:MAG: type III secretion system export apparatus subunit SctT [Puniceicoccales bacterium]|jgi:type III secretion protein T|nr:type III secretion system export apparatus subunit SctT [Puniceicoccales bacterium]